MHGLINRSFEGFLKTTYGGDVWRMVADGAGVSRHGMEALQIHDDTVSEALLTGAMRALDRPRGELLEDFGIYLVSHPNTGALRRLLRFSGATFADFLHSIDELPDRARLAVPDLDLPSLDLRDVTPGSFILTCSWHFRGAGHVVAGALRSMADDYGALALVEHLGADGGTETISIDLLDHAFSAGRDFRLAAGS